jgi:hypothetical protein
LKCAQNSSLDATIWSERVTVSEMSGTSTTVSQGNNSYQQSLDAQNAHFWSFLARFCVYLARFCAG